MKHKTLVVVLVFALVMSTLTACSQPEEVKPILNVTTDYQDQLEPEKAPELTQVPIADETVPLEFDGPTWNDLRLIYGLDKLPTPSPTPTPAPDQITVEVDTTPKEELDKSGHLTTKYHITPVKVKKKNYLYVKGQWYITNDDLYIKGHVNNKCSAENFRKGPSTGNEVIRTIKRDAPVYIYEAAWMSDGSVWYKTVDPSDGTQGWQHSYYIDIDDDQKVFTNLSKIEFILNEGLVPSAVPTQKPDKTPSTIPTLVPTTTDKPTVTPTPRPTTVVITSEPTSTPKPTPAPTKIVITGTPAVTPTAKPTATSAPTTKINPPYGADAINDPTKEYYQSKVKKAFEKAGFTNIELKATPYDKAVGQPEGLVYRITIANNGSFSKDTTFYKDAEVVIWYYSRKDSVVNPTPTPTATPIPTTTPSPTPTPVYDANIRFSPYDSSELTGTNGTIMYKDEVEKAYKNAKFTRISLIPTKYDSKVGQPEGMVYKVEIGGSSGFTKTTQFFKDSDVNIYYYTRANIGQTGDDIDKITSPYDSSVFKANISSDEYLKTSVTNTYISAGFSNFEYEATYYNPTIGQPEGMVYRVDIAGQGGFTTDTMFYKDAKVKIFYYTRNAVTPYTNKQCLNMSPQNLIPTLVNNGWIHIEVNGIVYNVNDPNNGKPIYEFILSEYGNKPIYYVTIYDEKGYTLPGIASNGFEANRECSTSYKFVMNVTTE